MVDSRLASRVIVNSRVAGPVSWHGTLSLRYARDGERTLAHDRHDGPLRILKALYPEGAGICHHVLVHPPGGIVGGDVLDIDATLDAGTHALITTAGATRFYRSSGAHAAQRAVLRVADGARLEWLPLESIAYSGCLAENRVQLELAPGAECIGWDVLALGLPAAGEPFAAGRFTQHTEMPAKWLERGRIAANDTLLLDSPLGLAGHRVLAMAWLACGAPIGDARCDALLDIARESARASPLAASCGVTRPHDGVIVMRALADSVEPAMALLQCVRAAWRQSAWQLAPNPPRVWRT